MKTTSNILVLLGLATAAQNCSAWSVPRPFPSSAFSKVISRPKTTTTSSRCPFANLASTTDASTDVDDDVDACEVPQPNTFLLDRIGGEAALTAAVDGLYDRLIVDPKLAEYFKGVTMEKLKAHQLNFMRLAFTEIPKDCDVGGMLIRGHGRLWDMGLDETDFDCVAGHLVDTMKSLGVGQEEIDEALSVVGPLRGIFEKDGHPMPDEE